MKRVVIVNGPNRAELTRLEGEQNHLFRYEVQLFCYPNKLCLHIERFTNLEDALDYAMTATYGEQE